MMAKKYGKLTYRGVTLDRHTRRAVEWAEKDCGLTFRIAQGSYNRGGVSASAGTHDAGATIDVGLAGISQTNRKKILRSLKRAGFAAWIRYDWQGFPPHIHAIAFGNSKASAGAKAQRRSYDQGRDGLARNRPDPDPWRTKRKRKFSFVLRRPVWRI